MGGGLTNSLNSSPEEQSSLEQTFPQPSSSSSSPLKPSYLPGNETDDGTVNGEDGSEFGGYEEANRSLQSTSELETWQKKRCKAYKEVLQSYDQLQIRSKSLKEGKSRILSYTPGRWIEKVGGMTISDYDVPETTTLLLIGPRGSGKSSLVNKISNVFEDDVFAPERAQISYNPSVGDGTLFLQEYKIPRGSTSFCLYDTRSLSDDTSENIEMLKKWMKKGVRHGKLIIRPSDSLSLMARMRCKARETGSLRQDTRMVNFVIFVVDGLAVRQSMRGKGTYYTRAIAETFNSPYLSFKDDKPAVVVTHGDLQSLADRTRVRVYLGELLGISPVKQIFDIPESNDQSTELTIVDMLRYSLEHADKNLPQKDWLSEKIREVREASPSTRTVLLIIFVATIISIWLKHVGAVRARKPEFHIDWRTTRHLWLD